MRRPGRHESPRKAHRGYLYSLSVTRQGNPCSVVEAWFLYAAFWYLAGGFAAAIFLAVTGS